MKLCLTSRRRMLMTYKWALGALSSKTCTSLASRRGKELGFTLMTSMKTFIQTSGRVQNQAQRVIGVTMLKRARNSGKIVKQEGQEKAKVGSGIEMTLPRKYGMNSTISSISTTMISERTHEMKQKEPIIKQILR